MQAFDLDEVRGITIKCSSCDGAVSYASVGQAYVHKGCPLAGCNVEWADRAPEVVQLVAALQEIYARSCRP